LFKPLLLDVFSHHIGYACNHLAVKTSASMVNSCFIIYNKLGISRGWQVTVSLHTWTTESNARQKSVFAIVFITFSLIQILVAINWLPLSTLSGTAFLLFNALMLLLGVSLLLGAKEVITVNTKLQTIVLETAGLFGKRVTVVPLNDVADFSVRHDGYSSEDNIRYYVAATLKTGGVIALFQGFYEGNRDREIVEARCERLRRMLPTELS